MQTNQLPNFVTDDAAIMKPSILQLLRDSHVPFGPPRELRPYPVLMSASPWFAHA